MKNTYKILFALLCVVAFLSFGPWIYSIIFPTVTSDPFIAYSPISDSFVVSDINGDETDIYTIDKNGIRQIIGLTKNDRDSLVPQMYYNQLNAKGAMPDSINGTAIDIPTLKHSQWVFNSLPRDLNRFTPGVYPIMESRPKRVELEDPKEVFTLDDKIVFIDMASNEVNTERSKKFKDVLAQRGFRYPAISASADITAKKAYDEGYLLIDSSSRLYHMKMQAGQPYVAAISMPEGATPEHAFILENPDRQLIGLVSTAEGEIYAIEREGYKPVKLPINDVYPERQRIVIMKNLFNWVIKITENRKSRWTALDSDDYSLLSEVSTDQLNNGYQEGTSSMAEMVANWIFPFRITFTDIDDCYAYPRISDFSLPATILWIIVIGCIFFVYKRQK